MSSPSTAGVTKGVGDDWAALTGRSIDAARVSALLTSHDEQTAAAAKLGSEGKYKDAIAQLDASDATIAESRALADRLAATTDVSTLTGMDRPQRRLRRGPAGAVRRRSSSRARA